MDIAAVIVNYRTAQAAIEAALALDAELARWEHVILVVDNDSPDDSLTTLRAAFAGGAHGDRIRVVASGHNGGYGYGINVGVKSLLSLPRPPRYVYILNPDAQADRGTMSRLIGFLDAHPEAGLAGSLVHDPTGEVQAQAFRFPTVWSELEGTAHWGPITKLLRRHQVALEPDRTGEVDWVPGTSMLVRREVFTTAGLFDEGFFLYFEEVDFARRVKDAGWKVYFVADAGITHIGSLATGMTDASRPMPGYWFQARRRYFVKHHGRLYGAACDAAWLSGHAIYLAKQRLRRRAQTVRPRLWRDFASYSLAHALEPAPRAAQNAGLPVSDHAPTCGAPGEDRRPSAALRLEELWKEDLATHDHDLKNPGFWAVAVHRLAEAAGRPGASRLRRSLFKGAHTALSTGIDWFWGIHIPASVELGRRVRLFRGSMLLNARSIGNDVHIRHHATFGPTSGAASSPGDLPTIEESAAIGAGVCVLGAVNVGRGSVVEDNAVVLQDVPPQATATGIPARVAAGASR